MSIYTDEGYKGRRDYLESLADEFGVPKETVFMLASMLGPDEDFDGLVTSVEDAAQQIQLDEERGTGAEEASFSPRDILTLSSGTMAGLTGLKNYEDIDAVQEIFYEWAVNSGRSFSSWQEAWRAFKITAPKVVPLGTF